MKTLLSLAIVVAGVCIAGAQQKKISQLTFTNAPADGALLEISAPNGTGYVTRATSKALFLSNAVASGAWVFNGGVVYVNGAEPLLDFQATGSGTVQRDVIRILWPDENGTLIKAGTNIFQIVDNRSGDAWLSYEADTETLTLGDFAFFRYGSDADLFGPIRARGGYRSADGTDGQTIVDQGVTYKNGLRTGGSFVGTNVQAVTATNAIGNDGGNGTNTSLYGSTFLGTANAVSVQATNYRSADGSLGASGASGAATVKNGLTTTLGTSTGTGAFVLEDAPTIDSATLNSPTISGASVTDALDFSFPASAPGEEVFTLHEDGTLKAVLTTGGGFYTEGVISTAGLTNRSGFVHLPTNSADFTVTTNGVHAGSAVANLQSFTNGPSRAFVSFRYFFQTVNNNETVWARLYAQNGGSGTYEMQAAAWFSRSSAGGGNENIEGQLCAFIDPGSRFYIERFGSTTVTGPLIKQF